MYIYIYTFLHICILCCSPQEEHAQKPVRLAWKLPRPQAEADGFGRGAIAFWNYIGLVLNSEYLSLFTYLYIYIYIHMYIHICIYIYVYVCI